MAVDAVNSLQASTDERDIRLPFTAREELRPLEAVLWEKLHSSCTQHFCSVDKHPSGFSSISKVLELFKSCLLLGVRRCPFLVQTSTLCIVYNEV